ncbi:MAG: 4Fe-4S dicluster-binding protein [Halobacteria archaeon]|nr:4Fe-4S dicluster-binding protein [Halobacteria archaeon]
MPAVVREEDCIGCTKCEKVCPVDTIDMVEGDGAENGNGMVAFVNLDGCVGCAECLIECPVDCIYMDHDADIADEGADHDYISI